LTYIEEKTYDEHKRCRRSHLCDAPGHLNVYGFQKITEEQSKRTIINNSYFQPNGDCDMGASLKERVYYAVRGSLTVNGKDGEKHDLRPGDRIYIGPGEERDMVINCGKPCEVLAIMVAPQNSV
jgi:mannose-6-phosphate isomerase-like protein (cupin superfamily)